MKFEAMSNGKMFADYITLIGIYYLYNDGRANVKNINFLSIEKYILSKYDRYTIMLSIYIYTILFYFILL